MARDRIIPFPGRQSPPAPDSDPIDVGPPVYQIPKPLVGVFREIIAITDAFCLKHLDDSYLELAREMAEELCDLRPTPLASGKPLSWACGILYALGRVNFLSDPATKPHMTLDELCRGIGVSPATGAAKSSRIFKLLELCQFHPDWTVDSMLDSNPLVWMIEMNDGMVIDARMLPIEAQEVLVNSGVIPHTTPPADPEFARRLAERYGGHS